MTIAANIAARDRFTAFLGRRYLTVDASSHPTFDFTARRADEATNARQMSEAEEKLFGWVYKQPGMATLDDCKAILRRVHDERGMEDSVALLQRFGIAHMGLDKLWIGMYQGFFDYARHCLYYGISPMYAWTGPMDIPQEVRDRWLLWHAESESLYEVRGMPPGELAGGEVSDVSAMAEWEKRFADQQTGVKEEEEL